MDGSSTLRTVTAPGAPSNQITLGPGTVRYVNSGGGGSTTSGGLTRESAFTTIDSAIDASSAGDTIVIMEGHSETKSASGALFTADVAGIKFIGEGVGSRRPTLTFSHTGATTTISGANILMRNILFVTGIDSVTTFGTVSGADFVMEDCEWRDTTDVEVISDWTCTGARPTFRRCFKNGYTGGNANARCISLNGVDGALIEDCRFSTKVTTAVVNFVSTACTDAEVRDCTFLVTSTTNFSKNVVDTATGSTWAVTGNCFDVGAGSHFSGGSGGALAGDDVGAVSSSVVSAATAASTANSSALSATVSLGTANSTAHSSTLSAAASVGVQINTADLLSSIVSNGVSIVALCSNA